MAIPMTRLFDPYAILDSGLPLVSGRGAIRLRVYRASHSAIGSIIGRSISKAARWNS